MLMPVQGQTFADRFLILSILGEGGFGTVYAASDLSTSLAVALKVLKPLDDEGYDRTTRLRFEREVQMVGQLRDPHTVTLHLYGESPEGLLFAAFELVPGQDLSELLTERERLEFAEVIHILQQVLCSLAEAHTLGLLHRDLKPENIRVLNHQGDPLFAKLLDFGLARSTDDGHPSATKTGEIVGTPRYMSPEQIRDQPLSAQSDIYSLGLLGFELLLGRKALSGYSILEQIDRLVEGPARSIADADRAGPLLPILRRMTAVEPADRYPSAAAVLAALDQVAAAGPTLRTAPAAVAPPRYTEPALARPSPRPARPTVPLPPAPSAPPAPGASGRIIAALAAGAVALVAILFVAVGGLDPTMDDPPAVASHRRTVGSAAPLIQQGEPPAVVVHESDADPVEKQVPRGPLPEYASEGCGRDPGFEGRDSLGKRLIYLPEGYDPTVVHPVVILIHHKRSSAEKLLDASGFEALANRHRFVILAPRDNGTGWQNTRDLAKWMLQVFRDIGSFTCIDTRSAFVVSNGYGGRMTNELGCAPWIRAIATNSFLYQHIDEDWRCPDSPKPAISFVPTVSGKMPIDGSKPCVGDDFISLETYEELWRSRNDCGSERRSVGHFKGGECHEWDCQTPLRSCTVEGGYGWPGSGIYAFDLQCPRETPGEFPIGEMIWDFFQSTPEK